MARPSGQVIRGAQQRLERATGGPGRLQIILVLAAGVGVDGGDKAMVSAVAGQLERAFHIGHAEIGLVIAAASFVGAAFTLPAGLLVDRTRRNRLLTAGALLWRISEWLLGRGWALVRITLLGVALFVAALSFAPAIWVRNVYVGVALFIAGAAALAAANPPIDAARLDIVLPGLWGRGEAGRTALRGVLEGGAPLLVGVASNWLGGGADGLEWALLLMLVPLLAASLLAVPLRRTYPSDVATARASLDGLKEGTPRAEDKSSDS